MDEQQSLHPDDRAAAQRADAALARIEAATEALSRRHQHLRDAATAVVSELDRMIARG